MIFFPTNEKSWSESLKSIATAPEVEHGTPGTCAEKDLWRFYVHVLISYDFQVPAGLSWGAVDEIQVCFLIAMQSGRRYPSKPRRISFWDDIS